MSAAGEVCEIVVVGGYLYLPQPSYFEDEAAQQLIFDAMLGSDSMRRLDAFSRCALFATQNARTAAAGAIAGGGGESSNRQGVCVGTGLGAQATRVRYAKRLASAGPAGTNPIDFPDSIDGAPAAHIAMRWGLKGPSLTFVAGRGTAENAIAAACRQITLDRANRMHLVVGDIYEPWMSRSVRESSGFSGAPNLAPTDAVLALVLERRDPTKHPNDATRIVPLSNGLECACRGNESSFRDGMTPESDSADLCGVLWAAGAWLEVTTPIGSAGRSCQDGGDGALCCRIGPRSHLAFVRKVYR